MSDQALANYIALLSADVPHVRREAVIALMHLGRKARRAVPEVEGILGDGDREVRLWAACALPRIGAELTPNCRRYLLEALRAQGELWFLENAAASLLTAGDTDPEVVEEATKLLMLPCDPQGGFNEQEAWVRLQHYLAGILSMAGPSAVEAAPFLARRIATDGEPPVISPSATDPRPAFIRALGRLGAVAVARPCLEEVLRTGTAEMKAAAQLALADLR